jgi:hypothetical protein
MTSPGLHLAVTFSAPTNAPLNIASTVVVVHYEMYVGHPILTKWISISTTMHQASPGTNATTTGAGAGAGASFESANTNMFSKQQEHEQRHRTAKDGGAGGTTGTAHSPHISTLPLPFVSDIDAAAAAASPYPPQCNGAVRVFRHGSTLEDAIEFHAFVSGEALPCVWPITFL